MALSGGWIAGFGQAAGHILFKRELDLILGIEPRAIDRGELGLWMKVDDWQA